MSGRLIYLMGPSGSGKDSLLEAARERLAERNCVIARREITRSAEAVGEDAIGVTPAEFDQQEAAGGFALSWRANGLAYGIPKQIDDWLAAGQDVLVNGSRAYLPQARQRYPDLIGVFLTVEPAVLRERLLRRGRESLEQIEQRLARNTQFDAASAERDGLHLLDNSGAIERARDNLLALIGASRTCA
ncbi:phosphonate metabolism protein/1,5-bisphosphokinase (PRPP-forming) PhnN [Pseudomonas sp. MIL19]|uniref:phosphonate metabolism protein/1,5-bisphosphokinase (PRPP-forming) PhnN n=1 Tax=Pseudomonas sp. MIL19 TaxID=2976979 RepID=UPI0023636FAE|nr:phosphonate metabolism protein/1,5-bisphosphokinase (PRPP-forming) PhnN [Pseudomonas sp. MIL19]MBU0903381.1 phosphonate metabolism protein/1,5-bisphosphokinase (PRPP-forming) PhnN [Gammaproteobacteria bacterium]MDD2161794.1 phosphonate metabolism protein/1,5-bisphosphokinase (PRPP-forming) PhnN [Pseudomonas sp. MIL19]